MQCSPQELKEKLLNHLDNDYNVVDLQGAFDVMAILERYPITKEHLEQTRIGKYVNEMRRRTSDRSLARRAKDLVRKWQQLVATQSSSLPTTSSTAVPSNRSAGEISRVSSSGSLADSGSHVPTANGVRATTTNRSSNGPYVRPPTQEGVSVEKQLSRPSTSDVTESRYQPSRGKSSVEKSWVRSSHAMSPPAAPTMAASTQSTTFNSLRRPATPSPVSFRPQTPSPQMTSITAKSQATGATANSSKLSPNYSHCVTNGTDPSSYNLLHDGAGTSGKMKPSGSTDALLDVKRKYANGRNGMLKASSSGNLVCNGIWSVHSDIDMNSATADRVTSFPDTSRADAPLAKLKIKINRTSATGSVSSPVADLSPAAAQAAAVRKTPKVATTAELIQRLHANGELRLVASETLNRIATNQIEHEADDSNVSIVPEGAKPRPHKKRRMERLPDQLPPAMTDSDLLQVKAERVRSFVQMSADASTTAADDLLGLLPNLPPPASATVTADATRCLEPEMVPIDNVSAALELPSITDFEIDWDSNTYTLPDFRPPPTDADVDFLLSGQWPSVSGQYDYCGEWTDWTQSYSAQSYDGSLIHILPYVDIDD